MYRNPRYLAFLMEITSIWEYVARPKVRELTALSKGCSEFESWHDSVDSPLSELRALKPGTAFQIAIRLLSYKANGSTIKVPML